MTTALRTGQRLLTPNESTAARVLGSFLRSESYAQLYRHVAGNQLIAADVARSRAVVERMAPRERFILELLALGKADLHDPPPNECHAVIDALSNAGLITFDGARRSVSTTDWIVIPALGGYLMSGVPAPYKVAHQVGASAYVGTDSLFLAAAMAGASGGRVLDLGCGSGLQGLLAARGASEAVLTDVDEHSLTLSALNAVINDVSHPVSIRRGSFYEPVRGERFDTIVVLPPYVPSVPDSGASQTVDGGRDGLEFIRPLLKQAGAHLTDDGQFIAICQLLCDDDGPLLMRELHTLAPDLDVRVSLSNWHPLQPYALELATRLVAHGSSLDVRTLMNRYLSSLREVGVTGACTADLHAVRNAGSDPPVERHVGRAPRLRATSKPLRASGLVVDRSGPMDVITTSTGEQLALNKPTADLLIFCESNRPIHEIVSLAWSSHVSDDRLRADLEDQAIERFLELERAGLVSFD